MLRLHIIQSVLVLGGSRSETNEYTRCANRGRFDEQSHYPGRDDCRPGFNLYWLRPHQELLIRSRCWLWLLQLNASSICAGLSPLEIATRHPQWWRGSAQEERSKNAHESELLGMQLERLGLKDKAYKYFKTFNIEETEAMAKQIPSLGDIPLVAGVINFLDILAHGRSNNDLLMELAPDEVAFRSVMRSWFQHSALYDLLRSLAQKSGNVRFN